MDKKILMLCTGNSCRSIIAEAIVNRYLDGFSACSSGVASSGSVNPLAKQVLKEHNCWLDKYHSKKLDKVLSEEFDLVVTLCDDAKENCPVFPKKTKTIHVGFDDPTGKEYQEYIKTFKKIKQHLLPKIKEEF